MTTNTGNRLIRRLYERATGRPWLTVRSVTDEFGPTPGARYADLLDQYTDAELLAFGDLILAACIAADHNPDPVPDPATR
ncbi:hypothetical protein AWW66_29115 [Micromonospora rosaria]|uniref:Spread protein n=1 Tax=Micromonospora rosaria TaxID=47874 RepID=Q58SZ5_9ACTN|nr:hypothetical protein [Micromonospora rosaria]AAX39000.1 spread protein [Micromonospora rosaria]KXK58550.1 hypothetical protein AWW66_29115 [Micromonospora rosaria]